MTTMLVLIVLKAGEITGTFLGDFDFANACHEVANVLAQQLSFGMAPSDLLELVKDADAATLMCIARPEA